MVRFSGVERPRITIDAVIARLAGRQHGIVAREQLLALGLTADAIKHRLRAGRLHRLHQGVYAVGHTALTRYGRWLAAVLACGPGATLSHRSAAELLGLLPPTNRWPDVTTTTQRGRTRRAITHHHTHSLVARDHVTTRDHIPVTTPARTLEDLRTTATPREHKRASDQAAARYDLHPADIGDLDRTRSDFEILMRRLIADARFPRPEINALVEGEEVDLVWRKQRLIVELDSWSDHASRAAFERDRRRSTLLQAKGWIVLRFTWRQLTEEPGWVIAQLARTLSP